MGGLRGLSPKRGFGNLKLGVPLQALQHLKHPGLAQVIEAPEQLVAKQHHWASKKGAESHDAKRHHKPRACKE